MKPFKSIGQIDESASRVKGWAQEGDESVGAGIEVLKD